MQFTEDFVTETSGSLGLDLIVTNPGTPTVSEPPTWSMLVVGFLGFGGLGLRRRSAPFRPRNGAPGRDRTDTDPGGAILPPAT